MAQNIAVGLATRTDTLSFGATQPLCVAVDDRLECFKFAPILGVAISNFFDVAAASIISLVIQKSIESFDELCTFKRCIDVENAILAKWLTILFIWPFEESLFDAQEVYQEVVEALDFDV